MSTSWALAAAMPLVVILAANAARMLKAAHAGDLPRTVAYGFTFLALTILFVAVVVP